MWYLRMLSAITLLRPFLLSHSVTLSFQSFAHQPPAIYIHLLSQATLNLLPFSSGAEVTASICFKLFPSEIQLFTHLPLLSAVASTKGVVTEDRGQTIPLFSLLFFFLVGVCYDICEETAIQWEKPMFKYISTVLIFVYSSLFSANVCCFCCCYPLVF